jgi:hypothetical protein
MSESTPQVAPARNNAEMIAQFLIPHSQFNILRNLEEIVKVFLGWASVTLEVFVRRDFGERYFTIGRILIGYLFIRFVLALANYRQALAVLPMVEPPVHLHTINQWYVSSFVLLALVHLVRIFLRNLAGVPWYSRSFGVSWFDFLIPLSGYRISDWVLYRFIEPGICFAFAWFILPEGSFTRGWLIFASLGLFFHNNMAFNMTRSRYLDLVDGEIASRFYNETREAQRGVRTSKYQTAGYTVVPVPRMAQEVLPPDIAATVAATIGRSESEAFQTPSSAAD